MAGRRARPVLAVMPVGQLDNEREHRESADDDARLARGRRFKSLADIGPRSPPCGTERSCERAFAPARRSNPTRRGRRVTSPAGAVIITANGSARKLCDRLICAGRKKRRCTPTDLARDQADSLSDARVASFLEKRSLDPRAKLSSRERLRDSGDTGEVSAECQSAMGRWYGGTP